ncbi:MAG TPA: hypothetical protein VLC07_00250, partial [Solirubrobacterales bacterium]|nr:hypothetical protein [Solirubrobacterales bacterium]
MRERPLKLRPAGMYRGPLTVSLIPTGEFLPAISGGDKTPEEEQAEAEAAAKKAEEEREAAEDEARKAEEEAEKQPPEWGDLDKEKAERAVRNARAAEKQAKERARKAEEEAAELREAQETEQETIKRERDESRVAAEQATTAANNLLINEAVRDAAGELDVPVKKHRRLLKLVERDGITIDDDRNVHGATE